MSLPHHVSSICSGENLIVFVKCLTIASMGIGAGAGVAMNGTFMPTLAKLSTASAASLWAEMAFPAMGKMNALVVFSSIESTCDCVPEPLRSLADKSTSGSFYIVTQVSAFVTGSLGGSVVYYKTKNKYYLYGGLIMAAILPYTMVMFLPINKELFAFAKSGLADVDGSIAHKMMIWNRNQYGRTALNLIALFTTLYGTIKEGGGKKGSKSK